MERKLNKRLAFCITLVYLIAILGLIYRFQIYKQIPVSIGEPYGLGDIIDLLFAVIVVVIWCCALILSVGVIIFNFKRNWLSSLKALLYATVGLMGYFYIKSFH